MLIRQRFLFVILVLGLVLAAPAAAAEAQSGEIILQLTAPAFAEDILLPIIESFEAANPGIQVQLVTDQGFGMQIAGSDDPETYQDNLAEYFSSADILLVDASLTPDATRAGYVLNLAPLTASDPGYDPSAFHTTLLNSFEWDGGQWALPVSASFIVVTYLPAAFDAAGLAYPSASWTLDDFELAARTLTQYNPDGTILQPGAAIQGTNESLPALFLSLAGSTTYSDAAFPVTPDYSNPALAAILDQWVEIQAEGIVSQGGGGPDNEIPMTIGSFFGGRAIRFDVGGPGSEQTDETTEATALLPGGRAGLSVNGYAISSGTLYPEAAYALIQYLINDANAVTTTFGTVPAVKTVESTSAELTGPGGGPGGANLSFSLVPEALVPLLDDALAHGLPLSETLFSEGLISALNVMQSDGVDARTALDEAQIAVLERLSVADTRATTTRVTVAEPEAPVTLAPGEIALNFGVVQGGDGLFVFSLGGPGDQWSRLAEEFAASDPEVGLVNIDTADGNDLTSVAQNFDCFYSSSNLVPDADLSLLLSFDPLTSVDASFSRNDFIAGVFDQVQVNNQLWAYPLEISPLVLRFNPTLLSQAGVTLESGGWTVNDFEDTLRQVQQNLASDEAPLALNASGRTSLLMLIAIYGGLPFDTRTDPVVINFTDPTTMSAMQQVLDLVNNGYISYASEAGIGFVGGGDPNQSEFALFSNVMNAFGFGGGPGGGPGGPGGQGGQQTTPGYITFPQGTQYNAASFELGAGYITAQSRYPEACYRLITYLSTSGAVFNSMPVRYSQINDPDLALTRSAETIAFYQAQAALIDQPNTLLLPNNLNAQNFGMTDLLFQVFDRYIAGEVVDFESELREAEQLTNTYLECLAAIPPTSEAGGFDPAFFDEVLSCRTTVGLDS